MKCLRLCDWERGCIIKRKRKVRNWSLIRMDIERISGIFSWRGEFCIWKYVFGV